MYALASLYITVMQGPGVLMLRTVRLATRLWYKRLSGSMELYSFTITSYDSTKHFKVLAAPMHRQSYAPAAMAGYVLEKTYLRVKVESGMCT